MLKDGGRRPGRGAKRKEARELTGGRGIKESRDMGAEKGTEEATERGGQGEGCNPGGRMGREGQIMGEALERSMK